MPAYAYTPTSDVAKAVGIELLRVSEIYRDPVLPHGYGATRIATVTAVVRARRLFEAGYELADAGNGLEAAVLFRSVFETALVLGWLKADAELGFLIWMLDDQRSTLRDHENVRRSMRNERARLRRQGVPVSAVERGMTLGLLNRSNLIRFRVTVADLERQIRAFPNVHRRLNAFGRRATPTRTDPSNPK